MPLVVTFLALLVGLTAVFLGLSLTLQRLFYNQPAGQLPLQPTDAGSALPWAARYAAGGWLADTKSVPLFGATKPGSF